MAGSQIRPSRWTYFFFGGLIAAIAGRSVWARREQAEFTRDAPLAHTTRRLLRCVVGRDAQRLLDSRANAQGGNGVPSWTERVEDRLRRIAAFESQHDWPDRCVPIAHRLVRRLESELHAQRAQRAAADIEQSLALASRRRIELLHAVESGELAGSLATLAYEVSGMTSATEEGWTSPLRNDPSDLYPVHTVSFPHAARIADGAVDPRLVQPDVLLYQNDVDRRLHRVVYDANESPTDRALGRGALGSDDAREQAWLVAADDGDSLFVESEEPAALVTLPDSIRNGSEAFTTWSALLDGDALWFASVSDGITQLRRTSRTGAVQWQDVRTIGRRDDSIAAVLLPTVDGTRRLATLDRGPDSLAIAMHTLAADANDDTVTHPAGEWLTFDPHVRMCESTRARHVLLTDRFAMRAIRFDANGGVSTQDLRLDALGPLADRRAELHCNDTHALFFADFERRAETLVLFDYGESAPHLPRAPLFGTEPHLTGAGLSRDRLVITAANAVTLRAYDTSLERLATVADDSIETWEGGALLGIHSHADADGHRDERSVTVLQTIARDDQVALLTAVTEGTRIFVGRLASRDDGRTFQGD